MRKTLRLCQSLASFIKERSLDGYRDEVKPVLRDGIRKDSEKADFIKYLQGCEEFAHDSYSKLEDSINDAINSGFLEEKSATNPLFPYNSSSGWELIRLGLKGRKLTEGSPLRRWSYFVQFAHEDRSVIYNFLLGGISVMLVVQVFGTPLYNAFVSFTKFIVSLWSGAK
ncbi:MAG: hypothetical protein ABH880_02265 [Patescibacteria group bacterium]